MLQPKRQKYRKQQKGRNRGIALKGSTLSLILWPESLGVR